MGSIYIYISQVPEIVSTFEFDHRSSIFSLKLAAWRASRSRVPEIFSSKLTTWEASIPQVLQILFLPLSTGVLMAGPKDSGSAFDHRSSVFSSKLRARERMAGPRDSLCAFERRRSSFFLKTCCTGRERIAGPGTSLAVSPLLSPGIIHFTVQSRQSTPQCHGAATRSQSVTQHLSGEGA